MAFIEQIPPDGATGLLARIYEAAVERAGRVFQILRIQSLTPKTLQASLGLYVATMKGDSPLSRAQREMIAVVVSSANACHYWVDAHADDLRAEVHDDDLVRAIRTDYDSADIDAATKALLDYSIKVTRSPAEMTAGDVQRLRDAGWDDRAIHDATQVAAYFNYINRIADGLGVDPEPEMTWHR